MRTRYTVGIDLGTSNTVVAYAAPGAEGIQLLGIEQLVGRGEVAGRPLLPSVRYHPAPGELAPAETRLPWASSEAAVVGAFARELGAQVPGRLVASAKSWLSHPRVDRTAPILPWGAGEDVAKVSPVTASASYLAHVRAAWNARFPAAPLENQDLVLTVPASFDEGARALTVEAARQAGLTKLRLLEEPQAAFHDWLFRHRQRLAGELGASRLVLVCDVGGGTTDFTLIQVQAGAPGETPRLTRIGVGDHLMLGGDNMDLALAHRVERRLGEERLPAGRFAQLVQRCRMAKETLLGADAPPSTTVTLLGAGSRLVGGARSVDLTRDEVAALVVDGFLPLASPQARPQRRRSGIVEFGLPYPADPAISRHLVAFLDRHAAAAWAALGVDNPPVGTLPVPDTLLLNGGVFRAPALAERLQHILEAWGGKPVRVLHNDEPDVAVARGAVAHGLGRSAQAPAIGGGSARSYFLLLDPGREAAAAQAICVLPRGTEAGQEVDLPERSFALRLGRPVAFHLVSSTDDRRWRPGELARLDGERFVRLPPVATRLLAFQLRGDAGTPAADGDGGGAHPRLPQAIALIDRTFGGQMQNVDAKAVRQLRAQLERLLGRREDWDLALARARRRRRSADHERAWLNLAGFCLRPGAGAPLDAWRIEQLWALFEQGIQYVPEGRNWSEWWTLWRRVAGGLPEAAQLQVLEALAGHLEHADKKSRDPVQASYDDMVRLAASLEQVPVMHRVEVGKWLLERLARPSEKPQTWWALGRVGARAPLYGSPHHVVPPDVAAEWLTVVLSQDWKAVEPAPFAAAQIARMTGDRARDLPEALRQEVAHRLTACRAPQSWIRMVTEAAELEAADQGRSFGESLPPGLKLLA